MKNKKLFFAIIIGITLVLLLVSLVSTSKQAHASFTQSDSLAVKPVSSQIVADGAVTAQDTAVLHFQTGGKLIALPFKEGDKVQQGQTIAQLDTYVLQRQLTQALNTYRSTRDTFDQTQQTNQVGALSNEQSTSLKTAGAGIGGDTNYTVVTDTVKRIVDQNQANLDNAVINVELANYATQLSTLTSPLSGILTHEDVSVANQNVTPITSFTVVDPSSLVFRAEISESDIDFVTEGAHATVQLNGLTQQFVGTVTRVYPNKMTGANGQAVYKVDVSVPGLLSRGRLDQTGIVIITSSTSSSVMLVPSWVVLSHQSIWVLENGKQIIKHVVIGKTHGDMVEVVSGLQADDSVITNPKAIAQKQYQML